MNDKEKCICAADMTDWPIISNPDCPKHGAWHKHEQPESNGKLEPRVCECGRKWTDTDKEIAKRVIGNFMSEHVHGQALFVKHLISWLDKGVI